MLSDSAMGIDSSTTLSWPPNKRATLTPAKLRFREERKRIIRALEAKYRSIDDHEKGMRKFVLIRNNLRRLQREAREDKLSRHRANIMGSRVSNLSPSCLSASRSPSPHCDYPYADSPAPFADESIGSVDDDEVPPFKRPRLFFFDDDKENEKMESEAMMDTPLACPKESCKGLVDDAQDILRDLYETCASEGLPNRSTPPAPSCNALSPDTCGVTTTQTYTFNTSNSGNCSHSSTCNYSVSMSTSCSVSSSSDNFNSNSNSISSSTSSGTSNNNNNADSDWHNRQAPYQFTCGHTSLLGNGLQSVVFHSLITSLES